MEFGEIATYMKQKAFLLRKKKTTVGMASGFITGGRSHMVCCECFAQEGFVLGLFSKC